MDIFRPPLATRWQYRLYVRPANWRESIVLYLKGFRPLETQPSMIYNGYYVHPKDQWSNSRLMISHAWYHDGIQYRDRRRFFNEVNKLHQKEKQKIVRLNREGLTDHERSSKNTAPDR